jgi:Ala-tRNA(Pro) deacylase
MSVTENLKRFLDENRVKNEVLRHERADTAQEVAERLHIEGQELAKCVVVVAGGIKAMLILPATRRADLRSLGGTFNCAHARLATEAEIAEFFPGCEVGAMPPFGNLYGMRVICDEGLAKDEEIVFNAGTHTEAIRMKFADYVRLVKPEIRRLTQHASFA